MLPNNSSHYYQNYIWKFMWKRSSHFQIEDCSLEKSGLGKHNRVMGNINSHVKIHEAWFERPLSGWLTDSNWRDNREIFASKKNKKVSCRICSIWLPIRHHLLKIQWHQVKSFPWKQIFFLLNKEKRSNLIILLQDILKLIVGFWSLCPRRKAVSPMLSCYLNLVGCPSSQL